LNVNSLLPFATKLYPNMPRDFFLHLLTPLEFEALVVSICKRLFGEGTTPFASGRDGGRDARFFGRAQLIPSTNKPWDGHVVVQAKHAGTPGASCSDAGFMAYFRNGPKSELPKVKKLILDGDLNYYAVFTNRKLTSGADKEILQTIRGLPLTDAMLFGFEYITDFLRKNPDIARNLPTREELKPFDFAPDDMVEVITAVYDAIHLDKSRFSSAFDFSAVNKKKQKNRVNRMSDAYYNGVIVNEYMPLFDKMKRFLENDRNREYREIYHDIADELRQKIFVYRKEFESFEEIILYLIEEVKSARPDLRGKKRYVTFLLCYMYDDCDIGEREVA
jgi:hypothetical protein